MVLGGTKEAGAVMKRIKSMLDEKKTLDEIMNFINVSLP